MSHAIQMVDLQTQYAAIKDEIDRAVHDSVVVGEQRERDRGGK